MADPSLDTASQRRPTGLDAGARRLILQVVDEPPSEILSVFFLDSFAGYRDYFSAVDGVWGSGFRLMCERAVSEGEMSVDPALSFSLHPPPMGTRDAGALGLLGVMPEPDFRSAVQETLKLAPKQGSDVRITRICRSRGAPWAYDVSSGFQWVGDEEVEERALRPALSAIADPRFAGGVKAEFESARSELALGAPTALSQSVHQAGCSVESAMKVVLTEHKQPYRPGDTAQALFNVMEGAGIVPRYMERLVLAAATPRNKKGGHGAGAAAHVVIVEEAEAVFAAAAVAIAYLHSRLP